ncbi:uncharacterized protein LOC131893680 [Tigriopus californicus]|uniref:uncharacterized protein LOC131893680 n=1 Tax=Tigriopus californicus TaxID=6832 RepID=UPI0027DA7E4C|nr:uncharacterized protein LOC131893680 [Tigriopus californicus]
MVFAQNLIIFFTLLFSFVVTIEQVSGRANKSSLHSVGFHRQKKLFSLFNIVQFQNDPCQALAALRTSGTCLSAQECSSQGGTMDGNCASGFGVCCIFTVTGCGGTVTRNCTYVRNMGFPAPDTNTGRTCTVNINRAVMDVCQIRLDFGPTTMIPLGTLPGECGGTGDSLTVLSPHSRSQSAFPPPVCGTLTGQHMYFESGRSGALAGQINIAQGSVAGGRQYNIKVSYISCNSKLR